jgi:alpha-galactosidase
MRQALAAAPPDVQPLSRKILDVFGYFPATLDDHFVEYMPFAHEFCGTEGPDFDANLQHEQQRWDYMDLLSRGEADWGTYEERYGLEVGTSEELRMAEFFQPRSWADTLAAPIINAFEARVPVRMTAINMLNRGAIDNLPRDVFVETPAYVDDAGIHPLSVGPLPRDLAAFNVRDIQQTEAIVEAAVSGSRRLVVRAMMLDPTVDSVRAAVAALDEALDVQGELLPELD